MRKLLHYFITLVWFLNGLFCKIFNLVPRHEQIVRAILHTDHSRVWVVLIGISEVIMAIWILSKFKARINAIVQICVILLMNILEFILVPELLLWGKFNIVFALFFIGIIYWNSFVINQKKSL